MDRFNKKICARIKEHVLSTPDKQAVVGSGFILSYAELDSLSNRIAAMIVARLSLSATGICVGVYMERDRYLIPTILALLKLGVTYVPISKEVPQERIKLITDNCHMSLVVTSGDGGGQLFPGVPTINAGHAADSEPAFTPVADNGQCAYIIYTSGTTGQPKGVCISYQGLYALLTNLGRPAYTNLSADSRVLLFASVNFDASIPEIFGPLFYGGTVIVASQAHRSDVKLLYQLICSERVSFCLLPPSLLTRMPSFDFPAMDTLMAGGEPMVASLRQQALRHGYRFMNAYGPTENTVYSSMRNMADDVSPQNIGRPLEGIVGFVVDEHLRPVKPGDCGELLLGGQQLALGYLHQPQLTREAFVSSPFPGVARLYRTGDIVRLMTDGSYEFIGRNDSQVKIHGYRIELNDIKHSIEQCTGVWQAFVRTEPLGSDRHIVAYVQMKEGYAHDRVKAELASYLPSYMMPRFTVFVDQFPMNANGKIDAGRLKNTVLEKITCNDRELTATETVIMQVLAKIIGIANISVDAHFFNDLGLSSIQVMDALAMLEYAGLYVGASDFYDYPTIATLASRHSDARQSYWYRQPVKGKKTMVLVSGYTSFVFLYAKLAELIADHYNIFVIESYHDNRQRHHRTCEQFTDAYLEAVLPVQQEYGVDLITGFCLGGELGLLLAHKLHRQTGCLPHVVVLDGEVDRDKDTSRLAPLMFKGFPDELNVFRFETDKMLIASMPDFVYEGRVTTILSKQPMADVITEHHAAELVTDEHRRWARVYFDRAPEFWRRKYPDCEMLFLDVDHWGFLIDEERSTVPLARYFVSLAGQ